MSALLKGSPLVSVCIATYNRSELLVKAVNSVQKQDYSNIELIIVDDASTDDTKLTMARLQQSSNIPINYIQNETNLGLAGSRNRALNASEGKYFTFIDDDDRWVDSYLSEFVSLAENYDSSFCFICGCVSPNGEQLAIPEISGSLKALIEKGYTPPVAAQFYFRETLLSVGGYNESIKSGVDHDLWLSLAKNRCQLKSLSKCLAIPNYDDSMSRMTSRYKQRKDKINKSLVLWEPLLIETFGIEFKTHFVISYHQYIDERFFKSYLSQRMILQALKLFVQSASKFFLIKNILSFLSSKILKRTPEVEYKPLFQPFFR